MCELLGPSARPPIRLTFSLEVFAAHGGVTDRHRDGRGMAFREDGDARGFREPPPAAARPLVRFPEGRGPTSFHLDGEPPFVLDSRHRRRGGRVLARRGGMGTGREDP